MTGSNLARPRDASREVAHVAPIDTFRPLDRYAGGLSDEQPRVPWLATISAGYKDESGYPKASRRTDQRWIHPPSGLELTPRLWQDLARTALAEGEMLRLPAPSVESIDDAADTLDVDLDEPPPMATVAALQQGPMCDARFYERAWFALVRGSVLDSDETRATFIRAFSHGATSSLSAFLASATEEQAAALLAAAGHHIAVQSTFENARENARKYDEVFGSDEQGSVYDLGRGAARNADGDLVDTTSGEVIEERPAAAAPSRSELWQENRRLVGRAAELGLTGVPTLGNRSTDDVIAAANRELAGRIRSIELDQQEHERQRQQEGVMF